MILLLFTTIIIIFILSDIPQFTGTVFNHDNGKYHAPTKKKLKFFPRLDRPYLHGLLGKGVTFLISDRFSHFIQHIEHKIKM